MGLRLAPGEQVRVRTRSHPRALIMPVLRLMLIALATGYVQGFLARPDLAEVLVDSRSWLVVAAWILAAVALLFGCLRPAWRWFNRRTLLTTRRILQRAGIGKCRERSLHLLSVYDVRLRQRRGQKMTRSGDLLVDHGAGGSWVLANMPEAARFRELILREVGALRQEISAHAGTAGPPVAPGPALRPAPGPMMRGDYRG
ncbi:PH (Pleckstrin Homology) domain-containing protein [Citricoccus muralis]|uniref:PH (Pleckstrin Homology) domain-containing protein n=1 Tax=Citricoccus muralis TaxID=169134 RepID=A0A3D9L7X8_9MICC|nr:PH (Pleckstrin Homology) domain-containing protein [Citricoccus muralis]